MHHSLRNLEDSWILPSRGLVQAGQKAIPPSERPVGSDGTFATVGTRLG